MGSPVQRPHPCPATLTRPRFLCLLTNPPTTELVRKRERAGKTRTQRGSRKCRERRVPGKATTSQGVGSESWGPSVREEAGQTPRRLAPQTSVYRHPPETLCFLEQTRSFKGTNLIGSVADKSFRIKAGLETEPRAPWSQATARSHPQTPCRLGTRQTAGPSRPSEDSEKPLLLTWTCFAGPV